MRQLYEAKVKDVTERDKKASERGNRGRGVVTSLSAGYSSLPQRETAARGTLCRCRSALRRRQVHDLSQQLAEATGRLQTAGQELDDSRRRFKVLRDELEESRKRLKISEIEKELLLENMRIMTQQQGGRAGASGKPSAATMVSEALGSATRSLQPPPEGNYDRGEMASRPRTGRVEDPSAYSSFGCPPVGRR